MSSINFSVTGKGPPIILLHGFCETSQVWDSFGGILSGSNRVYMPDLPGFGGTKLLKSDFTIAEIGSELNKWAVQEGIRKAIVLGHSLGGYVALEMVSQDNGLYSGLGLIHSTARADTEAKKITRNKVIDFVESNGVEAFVKSFIPGLYHQKDHSSIAEVLKIAQKTQKSTFLGYTRAMRDRPSKEDILSTSSGPILIIGGINDPVIDIEDLKEQASLNNRIILAALSGVGHMGMHEAEEKMAAIVNSFITSIRTTS